MARSVRLRLSAGLAAGVVIAAVPVAAAAAGASSGPGPNTLVKVQAGMTAASLPGAQPFGNTPPNTPETVSFVLRERHLDQLEAAVTHGVGRYLSVREFASEYGQSTYVISALEGYLKQFGITATADADNIDVVANGTAGEFDQALSVTQKQYHVPELRGHGTSKPVRAQTVHAATGAPELPERIARNVLSVLGLTNYSAFASQTTHVNTKLLKRQSGSSNSCLAIGGPPAGCNLPANFAADYGLKPLYAKSADGAGQTVAIVTLAALDPTAPSTTGRR